MNLDTTRKRRNLLFLERIAEERAARGRKGDKPIARRVPPPRTMIVYDAPPEGGGGPAVITRVGGLPLLTKSQYDKNNFASKVSRVTHKRGPVSGKATFEPTDMDGMGYGRVNGGTNDQVSE